MAERESVDHLAEDGTFTSVTHQNDLLGGLAKMFNCTDWSDLTIRAGNSQLNGHKMLLSIGSEYFHTMFNSGLKEQNKKEIELKEIDGALFKVLCEFLYTGKVKLTDSNAADLLMLADYFSLTTLEKGCLEYLVSTVHIGNCVERLQFACKFDKYEIKVMAIKTICMNLASFKDDSRLMNIDGKIIVDILRSDLIGCQEDYELTTSWVETNIKQQPEYHYKLMKCVKFDKLSPTFMFDVVFNSIHMFSEDGRVRELIRRAMQALCGPSQLNRSSQAIALLGGYGAKRFLVCRPTEDGVSVEALPEGWDQIQHLLNSFSSTYACSLRDSIFVSGRVNVDIDYGLIVYNVGLKAWSSTGQPPLKDVVMNPIGDIDNCIFSFGGWNRAIGHHLKDIYKYDIKGDSWSKLTSGLPFVLTSPAIAVYGKGVYLFGGESASWNVSKSIIHFDSQNETCTILDTQLVESSPFMSAALLYGLIYIIGGENLYSFDPKSTSLSVLPRLQQCKGLSQQGLSALCGKLYVFGGRNRRNRAMSDNVHCYDPIVKAWRTIGKLPERNAFTSSVVMPL